MKTKSNFIMRLAVMMVMAMSAVDAMAEAYFKDVYLVWRENAYVFGYQIEHIYYKNNFDHLLIMGFLQNTFQ